MVEKSITVQKAELYKMAIVLCEDEIDFVTVKFEVDSELSVKLWMHSLILQLGLGCLGPVA